MSLLQSLAVLTALTVLAMLAADLHHTMILMGGILALLLMSWSRQAAQLRRAYRRGPARGEGLHGKAARG